MKRLSLFFIVFLFSINFCHALQEVFLDEPVQNSITPLVKEEKDEVSLVIEKTLKEKLKDIYYLEVNY